MNIIPKLNLNKHPKDSTNLSLVNALNIKVTHDESAIVVEEGIKENVFIHNYLTTYYAIDYKIVGIIPCNNELIIIVKPSDTIDDSDIFRYQEPINDNVESMVLSYGGKTSLNRFKYLGGLIKGAFTYNVENSLIVAITEYNVIDVKIPLRTINLGNIGDSTISNDNDLSNAKLSTSPEVKVPSVDNLQYIAGSAYKGWYYLFIRYKINTVDYTQWHSIGVPIYIDTLEQYQIIRYCFNRDTRFADNPLNNIISPPNAPDGYGAGFSDYFSNTSDIAKETFKVDLLFTNPDDYDKYQIGVINASKTSTKAFRTSDIYYNDQNPDVRIQQYILDNKSLIEYNIEDLITDTSNYFNVKNIWNYQNRLYISNYTEDNANNNDIDKSITDNIIVSIVKGQVRDYGLVYDTALISGKDNGVNQYDTYSLTTIPLHKYLNVSEETLVTVTAIGYPTKTAKVGQFYITAGSSIPAFAYIQLREPGPLSSVIITNYGSSPQTTVYFTMPSLDGGTETSISIDTAAIAMDGGMKYINTDISFDDRKRESTLIPGEIYNFNIHFVNKYNAATNGYRISNNIIWDTEDNQGVEIIPVPFSIKVDDVSETYYAALPVDQNVSYFSFSTNNGYSINTDNIKFYKSYTATKLTTQITGLELTNVLKQFLEHYSSYANSKFVDTKWYQISYGPGDDNFHLFINNNGDRLFKVPLTESFTLGWDGFPDEIIDFKTYNIHTLIRLSISNIEIPAGYDGYYISYEKYEAQARATGMLTRNDFRSQDYIAVGSNTSVQGTTNTHKSDKMFFYSSIYDISDTIKLDYSIMRIEAVNPYKKEDIPQWDYFQRNYGFNYVHDMNKPEVTSYGVDFQKTYAIPNYKISVADSAIDNRMGLGTALQIEDSYNLFPNYDTSPSNNSKIKLYRVTLLNTTRDIYMSDSKTLVRMTDIYYRNPLLPVDNKYYTGFINSGYNGHYTYDNVIVYENAGIQYNTSSHKVTRFMENTEFYKTSVGIDTPHTYQNDLPFAAYVQTPICSDIFFESKSFKSTPTPVIFLVKITGEGDNAHSEFARGSMVTPANSIDLFENTQGSADQFNPKTYTNYRKDLVSVEQFDKTVRRSNVIQDESRVNGWRTFLLEGYKNITENKGKITNLIGIGTVFLVHTEHSLFLFDINNTLKTKDKDIQLVQPDAFEVGYKEVFTSDKGFGGLQDDKSWVVDQFGYIFYSVDTNRIYVFDDNKLDYLDDSIIEWLRKYKPTGVRMGNDKFNNRILIKFDYLINNITKHVIISFNYKIKSFVSAHSYYFDECYNTKTGLYMKCDNTHVGCSLHSFDYDRDIYARYDNILDSIGVLTIKESKVSIIMNVAFDTVKFLEYLTYKLTKYADSSEVDFTYSPVEEYITPFAGNTIKVYNNQTNTGVLDINVNSEGTKNVFANFDKPYWDLGVWNFSYLRNRINELPNGLSATEMSRIYGNYFIVEFTFNNLDNTRIELEELNYNISES